MNSQQYCRLKIQTGIPLPGVRAILLLACSLSFGLMPVQVVALNEKAIKEAELQKLRDIITHLRSDLGQVRDQFDLLNAELRKIERNIGEINRSITKLDQQLADSGRRLNEFQRRHDKLEHHITEQRRYLAVQVRAAYLMGRQEHLKILLNQEDPATIARMMTYYDYLNRARSERIQAIHTTLDELDRVKNTIKGENDRLSALRNRREKEKQELEAKGGERKAVLSDIKGEINSKDEQLGQLLRNEEKLVSLIKTLTEALADIPAEPGNRKPFAELRGHLTWPTRGKMLVHYGSQRKSSALRWQGVMIGGQSGQAVRSISHGRVAFADWLRGYGLLMIIDHSDGYMSLYGHNQTLYKEAGDWVDSDEVVAAVGNSGGQEDIALYFEIRENGQPVNPARWCQS